MIQTLNPYNNTAKTAEIMARYRPIAPKPEAGPVSSAATNDANSPLPQSIRKSPYLRNVWPHLQARPTRTRKRGRSSLVSGPPPPSNSKRARTCGGSLQCISPAFQVTASPAKTLSLQGFVHHHHHHHQVSQLSVNLVPLRCGIDITPITTSSNLVTLPLLPCSASLPALSITQEKQSEVSNFKEVIDLNEEANVPEELDFMKQLEMQPKSPVVITPRAVRPVGSTIIIDSINEVSGGEEGVKNPEEVEKEVEEEELPVVVSDSNNKVRLENSAYKELVGQPECCWLDCMQSSCKRIGGEVVLRTLDSGNFPFSSNGFTCNVKIEWESNGEKKKRNCVKAFCEATKLGCNKDYVFQWKFHIKEDCDESDLNA